MCPTSMGLYTPPLRFSLFLPVFMGWVFDIIFGGLHAPSVGDFSPTDAQSQIIKQDLNTKMGGWEKEEEITEQQ